MMDSADRRWGVGRAPNPRAVRTAAMTAVTSAAPKGLGDGCSDGSGVRQDQPEEDHASGDEIDTDDAEWRTGGDGSPAARNEWTALWQKENRVCPNRNQTRLSLGGSPEGDWRGLRLVESRRQGPVVGPSKGLGRLGVASWRRSRDPQPSLCDGRELALDRFIPIGAFIVPFGNSTRREAMSPLRHVCGEAGAAPAWRAVRRASGASPCP
jgi:hypothetical protein